MNHDVCLIYAARDGSVADVVRRGLEQCGLKCWMGLQHLGDTAIENCRAVVVLVSASASPSLHVTSLLGKAVLLKKRMIAIRLDSTTISKTMEKLLESSDWRDAMSASLDGCLRDVVGLLGGCMTAEQGLTATTQSAKTTRQGDNKPSAGFGTPHDTRPLTFISSKSADYEHARKVYEFLVSQGLNAFMSDESLPKVANADYREVIEEALDRAHHMIVVTSSAAHVEAPWVKHEWGFFVNAKLSGHKTGNILTLLVDGMTAAALPPGLRYLEALPYRADSLARLLMYLRHI